MRKKKNSDTITYPASLTKIMSAIVAIENIPDPNTTMLTVPQELVDQLVRENSSMAGFSAGETVSATDLLYGCLLSSGGEATGTLALYVGGGEESEFVAMMNKKAEELGCASTHFANPTGLHSISHTSTAIDMAKNIPLCPAKRDLPHYCDLIELLHLSYRAASERYHTDKHGVQGIFSGRT